MAMLNRFPTIFLMLTTRHYGMESDTITASRLDCIPKGRPNLFE